MSDFADAALAVEFAGAEFETLGTDVAALEAVLAGEVRVVVAGALAEWTSSRVAHLLAGLLQIQEAPWTSRSRTAQSSTGDSDGGNRL